MSANEAFAEAMAGLMKNNDERKAVVKEAESSLLRLVDVCRQKTGQSYKVRELLYSLWNGQPTSLLEVVSVDWEIRKDLVQVILAFGFECGKCAFYYDAIKKAFKDQGLFQWFTEAHREAQEV